MKVKGIGEVKSIHTMFSYSNTNPKNIRNIKEFGGGALMDIGVIRFHQPDGFLVENQKKYK